VDMPPPKLGLANATLGLAALGEFAVPVVLPVCVGLLVVNNLGTIRDAGKELSQGKLGLPVLYTALLGCSITTGQIVAHALMEWSFRYWERRASATLAEECKTLLEQTLPIPVDARLVRSEQVDAQVPSASLQPGQRIRIDSPAAIPVDGRVIGGVALVEQASARGIRQAVRKAHGDEVLAGSTVLHGNLEVEVWRVGSETQAAQIAHSVIGSVRELAVNPALRRSAEAMAERAVKPTLAVAGVGWAVGGLFTVGAVLHQDYISGPKLAIPLETLRDIGAALRGGVVVRRGDALQRLAETRFVVLDDHPAWTAAGLELHSLHSRLAASETDKLLCHIAGAGLYLGDGRAQALAEACRARGLVVRQPPLLTLAADRVAVRHGEHTLILRNAADDGETAGPLRVEMDGEEIAHLAFRASAVPQVAGAVRQLRGRGAQVFVLSSRPAAEASELAQRLGANLHGGDFSADEKLRFLQGLRRRGVLAAYVGNGQIAPELAEAAHVTVSLGGASGLAEDGVADLVVLGDSLDAYAETVDLALANRERIRASCRLALAPNLLCIAGGYGGLLNGITSGLIANVGVNRVYQQAARSARDGQRLPSQKRTLV
ncbi:MAG: cation-transporting ATPase, partial [Candidatus Methylumidiphilus sp.]